MHVCVLSWVVIKDRLRQPRETLTCMQIAQLSARRLTKPLFRLGQGLIFASPSANFLAVLYVDTGCTCMTNQKITPRRYYIDYFDATCKDKCMTVGFDVTCNSCSNVIAFLACYLLALHYVQNGNWINESLEKIVFKSSWFLAPET